MLTLSLPRRLPQARIGRLDIAIAVVMTALGVLLMIGNVDSPNDASDDISVLVIPLFLLVTAPVLWRSVSPLAALGAMVTALLLHSAIFGTEVVRCGAAFPAIAFVAFSAGARLQRRDALLGLGLAVVGAAVVGAFDALGFGVATLGIPLVAAAWGAGRVAHSRGAMIDELQGRTARLRTLRDERARLEVATDRVHLSGELEALLQRRLGELAAMADRGPQTLGDGTATAVLADIEHASRATLDEMRGLVGVLRGEDGSATVAPAPTLAALDALVVRAKGPAARIQVDGDPRMLPAAIELSAYRVVEHLLDAVEGADDLAVRVRFGAEDLELAVGGTSRRRAETLAALARARKHVELHRGTLQTASHGRRSESVATLPVLGGV